MTLFTIFIEFLDTILSFKILDIALIDYLKTIALVTIVILIIKNIANNNDN